MKITRKLGILVAVPLIATVAFAALAVVTSGSAAIQADRLRALSVTSSEAGELIYWLQTERAAAISLLTDVPGEQLDTYLTYTDTTDQAVTSYRRARDDLSSLPSGTAALLDRLDGELERLPGLREQVASEDAAATAVTFQYQIIIDDLIAYRESVPQAGGAPADVAERMRAAAALSQASEYVGEQQVAVLRALHVPALTSFAQQEITASRTGYIESTLSFSALAPTRWQVLLDQSSTGMEIVDSQLLEDTVARTPVGESLEVDAEEWRLATDVRLDRLRQVQTEIDAEIVAEVTDLRDSERQLTFIQIGAVAIIVVAAVGLAVWLGRPVVRGLKRLRDAANRVAAKDLPEMVAKLDDHEVLGNKSPDEFATQSPPPVRVRGKDELAEVGHAFNAVHHSAVRVAAQQALLRVHIAEIFVNLARRGHALSGRLTAALDEAERNEQDPSRLEQLFAFDHLITLQRRTNDSLLVLGGSSPAKVRQDDEPLSAVLTAAQGQVEQYTRISLGVIDDGAAVRAPFIDDVVMLLAELMDNGTRYSQPAVRVDARLLADRVLIQITDEGIGIPNDQREVLNERLTNRPPLDVDAVRAMGLTVVGHIADRHGIQVRLLPAQPRGTIAEVTLPTMMVSREYVPPALEAAPMPLAVTATTPDAAPPSRPPRRPGRPAAPLFKRRNDHRPRHRRPQREPDATRELPAIASGPDPADVPISPPIPAVELEWRTPGGEPIPMVTGGRHAADEENGWQRAERAAQPVTVDRTGTGLPKRNPMAQLVPGAIDVPKPVAVDDYRDPAAVGTTFSAYARGLATNRSAPSTTHRSKVES